MNPTVDKLFNRLETLTGDIDFRWGDGALESPDKLMAMGRHNLRQLQKIQAMDPECRERIQSLQFNILASGLQEEAMGKYGNTDANSVKKILEDCWSLPEKQQYADRVIGMVKQCVARFDLTKEEVATITDILNELPLMIMNTIVEITSQSRLLPRAEAQSMAAALADIMKDVEA